jgi:two-component system cell cycle response regulator
MSYQSKILLVDDEPAGLETLEDLLLVEGYALESAVDGRDALAKTDQFSPDLILLDVMMPGMDGYEVCRRLRAQPHTADIPIILLTALDDRQSRLQGIEAGADDFISKPYDRLELRARVRTITKLNRFRNISTERLKFELVVKNSSSAYILLDDNGYCSFANPRAFSFLEITAAEEALPFHFLQTAGEIFLCKSTAAWHNWPEPPLNNEKRYLVRPATISNRTLWLQVDTVEAFRSPEGNVWLIQLKDVTDQMISQHSMWKFHAAINHKLRTPLVGLYSGLEILAMDGARMDAEMLQEMLDLTFNSASRLHQEIESILAFIDSPTFVSDGQTTALESLPDLIRETVAEQNLRPARIDMQEQRRFSRLALSPQSLSLILTELVDNSRKFHPQQDPTLVFAVREDGRRISISLTDDGQHLMPEELHRVWQPYYQIERTFSGEIAGMGLGLATIATIIWGAGGSCRMENRLDADGTIVTITIPTLDA